ncbi:hypothetical protein NGB36_11710 [Streptomyces sp. RB6PN25]|uniref:SH3b domain-containing protein n=1 Tax=Streptomyces humicola TaxID=2953240 RepID=A0ABT1PXG5_9ACTN|nr:hypothetical protein [Streptomyces humicola]MCQ4081247.1 hypothetical protein [Streptomyces humicola]
MRRLAAAASAVAALLCVSAIPAQAAQAEHTPPLARGKVLAHHGGVARSGPGTNYTVIAHLRDGQIVPLLCRTSGQSVRGHRLWYRLNERPAMWISSVLISRVDKSPVWCARHGKVVHPRRLHHRKDGLVHTTGPRRHHPKAKHHHRHVVKHHGHHPLALQKSQGEQGGQGALNAQSLENQLSQATQQDMQNELQSELQKEQSRTSGMPTEVGGNG